MLLAITVAATLFTVLPMLVAFLLVGHVVFTLPFVVRTVLPVIGVVVIPGGTGDRRAAAFEWCQAKTSGGGPWRAEADWRGSELATRAHVIAQDHGGARVWESCHQLLADGLRWFLRFRFARAAHPRTRVHWQSIAPRAPCGADEAW